MNPIPEASADAPAHKGILREETVALRQLLGYGRPTEAAAKLGVPELGIRLPGTPMKDVLFVGLDIDTYQGYEVLIPDQQLHVGVSILDTRRLVALRDLGQHKGQLAPVIDSYQFTLGESKYCQRARNRFLFGKTKSVASIPELKLEVEQLVEGRDVVLVCHSTNCELKMLRNLGLDLRLIYIIDTNKVAQYALQLHYRYDLGRLLDALNISYASLHAAGNDARFCLQALLMLAVKDAEMGPTGTADDALLRLLEGIAHAPRRLSRGEIEATLARGRRAEREAQGAGEVEKRAARALARMERVKERERGDAEAESTPGGLPQNT